MNDQGSIELPAKYQIISKVKTREYSKIAKFW